ncbi:MAG: hypothetical protein B7733_20300 [Myxococcales bacterium FL481]|nr:MAG: hypothetical protein B7733_20300 [Myxococcales bacterium FL481]
MLVLGWACSPSDPGAAASSSGDAATFTSTDPSGPRLGVCGLLGEAVAAADVYEGTEQHYLIGDQGHGWDVCRVSVDVTFAGPPPVPCELCDFAMSVSFANPTVLTDVDGSCASSELALDPAAIAALAGHTAAYGHVSEYTGHNDVLMVYDPTQLRWNARSFATYDAETRSLRYDQRNGFCAY